MQPEYSRVTYLAFDVRREAVEVVEGVDVVVVQGGKGHCGVAGHFFSFMV